MGNQAQYRLFYRDVEIGSVIQEDENFPNLFGTFHPIAEIEQGHTQNEMFDRIERYIAYSVAADQLMQEGKEDEWDRFVAENESQFLDLIETDDWHLQGEGSLELILVPNFCQDNGIVWRWNLSPGSGN